MPLGFGFRIHLKKSPIRATEGLAVHWAHIVQKMRTALWSKTAGGGIQRGLDRGDQILTIISQNTQFEGTVEKGHNVLINGIFKGALSCSGEVVTNPSSEVCALIEGKDISINGMVHGTVRAERVRLESRARFSGKIYTHALQILDGAVFRGCCFMETEEEEGTEKA